MRGRLQRFTVSAAAAGLIAALAPAGAAATTAVFCGMVVTTSITVGNDLTNCPGDGLVVGASNVVIDLNGHTIDGNDTDNGGDERSESGIESVGRTAVTVKNGRITDFERGVGITGGAAHRLELLTIVSNTVDGIGLDGTDRSTVRRNTVRDNLFGIGVGGHDVIIEQNTVTGHFVGIFASPPGLVNEQSRNVVRQNTISANDDGIQVCCGGSDRVENNILSSNGIGIRYGSSRTGGAVRGNRISGGSEGIRVEAVGTTVEGNTVTGASSVGVLAQNGNAMTIRRNTLRSNNEGLDVLSGPNHVVTENTASDNTFDGIDIEPGVTGLTVTKNTADRNGDLGIEVSAAAGIAKAELNVARQNGDPAQCTANAGCV